MSNLEIEEIAPRAMEHFNGNRNDASPVSPVSADQRINQPGSRQTSKWWVASGIFLVVLALYVLTSPGRIDIVDGQARFDVAYNWLVNGRPLLADKWVGPFMGVSGRDGLRYSYYGAPGSVFSIPLVWLGLYINAPSILPSQFLFSLTSSIFGAGIAPILFLFYLELGIPMRKALAWAMVSSFATYVWPISNSTFENAQYAFFALTAVYFGVLSARRKSATYAALGGLTAGVLILYQEYFLLIIPALALSTFKWKSDNCSSELAPRSKGKSFLRRMVSAAQRMIRSVLVLMRSAWDGHNEVRSSYGRYCLFVATVSVGVALSIAFNHMRFGSYFDTGKMRSITAHSYPLLGNPLAGLLTLLISPGKSVFLYSPTLVLAVLGVRRLWRREPGLVTTIGASSLILVVFLSCISFVGGDWCWGPRYLTPLLALWALGLPFALGVNARRDLAVAIIGLSFVIQVLALSVENQRFFLEEKLDDYFWAEDSWAYFKRSALLARLGEAASLSEGLPATAQYFTSIPIPEWSTYSILGPPTNMSRQLAPKWMRFYKIFFLPRPWPLWMSWLSPALRPVDIGRWVLGLLGVALAGIGLIYTGLRKEECV